VIIEGLRLLLVDDDEQVLDAMAQYFGGVGCEVTAVMDGVTALNVSAQEGPFDAVVTDLMLPKMDGLALTRRIRERGGAYVPILMLTAKDDVVDKVLGLEAGADDYVTKPFALRELEARLKSAVSRGRATRAYEASEDAPILRGRLRIDPAKREVTVGDRQVELTPKEFELLRLFASNPGRVFPRKYLLEKIWDYSYEGYDRTIDSHINRLRAKIEDNPENPQMVLTVWGIGYKFTDIE
jgi:two-component system alkaline phosphatase synthesis response regulator PhoP